MKLTVDDLEWLDRIGVDSKRMKIIKQNQKLRELIEKEIKDKDEHPVVYCSIEIMERLLEESKK